MMWVDNSHTMKASELKGRRLMRNTATGETRFESVEPDAAELRLPVPEVVATTVQSRKRGKKNGS